MKIRVWMLCAVATLFWFGLGWDISGSTDMPEARATFVYVCLFATGILLIVTVVIFAVEGKMSNVVFKLKHGD